MTPQEALATIIRTLVSTDPATVVRQPRRRKRPRPPQRMTERQIPLDLPPTVAPELPVTQAELEALERQLRGESPNGYYKPAEGVAPWMEH